MRLVRSKGVRAGWGLVTCVAAAAMLVTACGGDGGDDDTPVAADYTLTLVHINDHHSTLDSKSKTLKLNAGGAAPVDVAVDAAGFARVTQAVEDIAKAAGPNVLKIHAGDAVTGTLYFNRAGADGEADAAMVNTVCFDTFTLGNHEFDKGDSGLKRFLDLIKKGGCNTAVLSANVSFGANSALHPSRAAGYVVPSKVIERGGQKIGVIGLTIAGKTKASSSPDPDTTFQDEATAAQREIDLLRAQGVNKIVVASHIGYEYDRQVAAKLSGVDVIVGGDSHTLLGPNTLSTLGVGSPAGAYPTLATDKDGKMVCVVQAWEYAQVVGELKVRFDAHGDVKECGGTPHVLIGDNFTLGGKAATEAEKAAINASVKAAGFLRVTAPSAKATSVLAPFKARVEVFNKTIVASAPQEVCSRRVPGGVGTVDYSRSSAACNAEGHVSLHGGAVQQLVAQAYLEVANKKYGGADITLQSGGGVRVPLQGEVTAANVIQVLPFGNMLFRLQVTGAEVKAMLEDGMEATFGSGGSTGPYPYAGGLRFDVDAKAATGARVSAVEVRDPATGAWAALDPAKTYRLFVLSFNATGGESTSYEKGRGVAADEGVLEAAFNGSHGWFWRNRSEATVTITLRTAGDYAQIKRVM